MHANLLYSFVKQNIRKSVKMSPAVLGYPIISFFAILFLVVVLLHCRVIYLGTEITRVYWPSHDLVAFSQNHLLSGKT